MAPCGVYYLSRRLIHYTLGVHQMSFEVGNSRTVCPHWKIASIIHARNLTHWGRVTHICVSNLTIIGSDNGLSPGRRQAIIWTNAGILLIEPLGTNFSEISIEKLTFSIKKMRLNVSSAKWCPFRLGLNVLNDVYASWMRSHRSNSDTNALQLRYVFASAIMIRHDM